MDYLLVAKPTRQVHRS